jgi:hypothetical protein
VSWFEKVLDAVQAAAIIGERVEKLGNAVAELAVEVREIDRRVARLEGAAQAGHPGSLPRLPDR